MARQTLNKPTNDEYDRRFVDGLVGELEHRDGLNFKKARTFADADIIELSPGRYPLAFWGSTGGTSLNLTTICKTGRAELLASNLDDTSNFAASAGAGVFEWAGFAAECYSVWDESIDNGYGGWGWVLPQTSAANVESNGGWYVDTVLDILYVKLSDSRQPDIDVRVNTQRRAYVGIDNGSEYYEGIDFRGGSLTSWDFSAGRKLYYNNCSSGYVGARDNSNFDTNSDTEAYYVNCQAFSAYKDCFGHRGSSKATEIDCTAYDTRLPGSNNASTTHDTCSSIRINCNYHDTTGDTCVDVSSLGSFLLGVDSYNTFSTTAKSDFNYTGGGGLGVGMWLINCSNNPTLPSQSTYAIEGSGKKFWQNTEDNIVGSVINAVPVDVVLY